LQDTWWRVDARPAPCLDLKLVHRGTRSARYRHLSSISDMEKMVNKLIKRAGQMHPIANREMVHTLTQMRLVRPKMKREENVK
jgi:hypothetical protein